MRTSRYPLVFGLSVLLGAAGAGWGADTTRVERASFAMVSDSDTVMFDDFTRTAETVEGRMTVGGFPRQQYTMSLGPRAVVLHTSVGVYPHRASRTDPVSLSILADFEGDSVLVGRRDRNGMKTRRFDIPANGMLGVIGSAAFLEQVILRAHALGDSLTQISVFLPENGQTWETSVSRMGNDSTKVVLSGEEWHFATSPDGRILGGRGLTTHLGLRRLPYRKH